MTTTAELNELIVKLIGKTTADELNWSAVEDGVELEMSDLVARVTKRGERGNVEYVFELLTEAGIPLDTVVESGEGASIFPPVSRLYEVAHARLRSNAIGKFLMALDRNQQPNPSHLSGFPSRPTEQDEMSLFAALKGGWHLDYSRGREQSEITMNGVYLVTNDKKNRVPEFQLRVIAINRAAKKIELAKDWLKDGKRLQIEVLELDDMDRPTHMEGEAKHDRHRLVYTRQS